ncbi:MAG TPA: type II secretion system protein [Acidobacteriaceae bacterium]|nr:type II secretion system protein [Acidobacteriaceae bacterium]
MSVLRQSGKGPRAQSAARPGEDGYILIAVLFLVALVLIGLAVAAPRMAKSIQRDKEIEAVHRGEQYKRAIQLYYRKFGRYPSSIDQLVDTNNIRFLRKKYTDPITGKDDWRLIHPGQAKVPPMGFFGQPLAGVPGAANLGAHVSGATGASAGTSAFGGSAFGSSMGSSSFGSPMSSSPSSGGTDVETPSLGISTPESGNPGTSTGSGSTGASPTSGASSSPFGSTDSSKPFGSTDAGSASPMGIGQIIGVGIPSTKASLLDYKKQDHYNKWEFVYFPIEDQMKAMGAMGAGGGTMNGNDGTKSGSPFGNNGSSFGNSNSPFGNSGSSSFGNSGSSFGNSGSTFGSAPSSGTTPPTTSNPQQ